MVLWCVLQGGDIRERRNAKKALIQCQNDQVLVVPQEKKVALCEIYGSFLVANDVGERTHSQFSDKQMVVVIRDVVFVDQFYLY